MGFIAWWVFAGSTLRRARQDSVPSVRKPGLFVLEGVDCTGVAWERVLLGVVAGGFEAGDASKYPSRGTVARTPPVVRAPLQGLSYCPDRPAGLRESVGGRPCPTAVEDPRSGSGPQG